MSCSTFLASTFLATAAALYSEKNRYESLLIHVPRCFSSHWLPRRSNEPKRTSARLSRARCVPSKAKHGAAALIDLLRCVACLGTETDQLRSTIFRTPLATLSRRSISSPSSTVQRAPYSDSSHPVAFLGRERRRPQPMATATGGTVVFAVQGFRIQTARSAKGPIVVCARSSRLGTVVFGGWGVAPIPMISIQKLFNTIF